MTESPDLAVIGGSGLYQMDALKETESIEMDTPFGKPSSPIISGKLSGKRVVFLARHGIGHVISPSEINYRANIYALRKLGAKQIVAISACGSLRNDYAPGHIVIPDQLFDYTHKRERSFFEKGLVAHVSLADPFCMELGEQVYTAVEKTGATVHKGGTFITIEGPRFSTKAESNLFRSWGMSIIGMTTSPEAFLAREAGMCYCVMGHVTDYDVWHTSEEPVTVEMVIQTMNNNTTYAQKAIQFLAESIKAANCCEDAMANALITNPEKIPAATKEKLDLLIGKYLPS